MISSALLETGHILGTKQVLRRLVSVKGFQIPLLLTCCCRWTWWCCSCCCVLALTWWRRRETLEAPSHPQSCDLWRTSGGCAHCKCNTHPHTCCLLLYSDILRSQEDTLCSHVILHEWIAFYSTFLNIHWSGVLTALTRKLKWLPSRHVLCTTYNHAPCHFM